MVRLTLADGSQVILARPVVVADSIVGSGEVGSVVRAGAGDVRALEVRRLNLTRTASLVVTQASFILSMIALIVHLQPHYRGLF
jgi:hypothetical protein